MRNLLFLLAFSTSLYAQVNPEIKFLDLELHSDFYKETIYKKELFNKYLGSDSLFLSFPKTIRSFEFSPDDNLQFYIKECDFRVKNIAQQENITEVKKEIAFYGRVDMKACYAKFIQTSPELRFAFELQDNTVIYHVKEVIVFIYNAKISLGTDTNYFKHKKDEREKLIFDITKIGEEQNVSLKQVHAIKDGGLALNLRLFSSDYWNGDFKKVKVLMHVVFKFTNGQDVQIEPFIIEM